MQTVAITPETSSAKRRTKAQFRATSQSKYAVASTMGAALDAVAEGSNATFSLAVVFIQNFQADEFLSATKAEQIRNKISAVQTKLDAGQMPAHEHVHQAEQAIEEEWLAAIQRSKQLLVASKKPGRK